MSRFVVPVLFRVKLELALPELAETFALVSRMLKEGVAYTDIVNRSIANTDKNNVLFMLTLKVILLESS